MALPGMPWRGVAEIVGGIVAGVAINDAGVAVVPPCVASIVAVVDAALPGWWLV